MAISLFKIMKPRKIRRHFVVGCLFTLEFFQKKISRHKKLSTYNCKLGKGFGPLLTFIQIHKKIVKIEKLPATLLSFFALDPGVILIKLLSILAKISIH